MNRRNFLAAAVAATGAAALPAVPVAVAAVLPAAVNSAEFWADSQPHKVMPYMVREDDLTTGYVKWSTRAVVVPLEDTRRFAEVARSCVWNETAQRWEATVEGCCWQDCAWMQSVVEHAKCLPIQ